MPSDNTFVFEQMLKMKRREMKPWVRKKTSNPKIRTQWLYPFVYEREYQRYIYSIMDEYAKLAMPTINNNIEYWLDEVKSDARQDDFNDDLQRLINELEKMNSDMFDENGKGVDTFNKASILAALTIFARDTSNFNNKQFQKMIKPVLGTNFYMDEPWLDNIIKTWANRNFNLIKSLTSEYIKKVNLIVSEGVESEFSSKKIMQQLRDMNKSMTRSRARLIARDQVGKLNGLLTKKRQTDIGIDTYTWLTAMDERVRARHKPLNGKLCRWDDDTVYSDDGGKTWKSRRSIKAYIGIPGEDIQCRCTSVPNYEPTIAKIDKELAKEEGQVISTAPLTKKKRKRRKTKTTNQKINDFENEALTFDHEEAVGYNKNGKLLLRKKGGSDEILFTPEEGKLLQGAHVFSHNHPGYTSGKGDYFTSSFSGADVELAQRLEMKRIRAVTNFQKKQKIVYEFKGLDKINRDEVQRLIRYKELEFEKAKEVLRSKGIFGEPSSTEHERIMNSNWIDAVSTFNNLHPKKKLEYRRITQ